ncbi:hypothetical protein ACWCPQ_21160 [Nocardia sp. NPDC001965]
MPEQRPTLPTRTTNRAIAATLRLWQDTWCTDTAILERIAAGLRGSPDNDPRTSLSPSTFHSEIGNTPSSDQQISRYPGAAGS